MRTYIVAIKGKKAFFGVKNQTTLLHLEILKKDLHDLQDLKVLQVRAKNGNQIVEILNQNSIEITSLSQFLRKPKIIEI